MNRNAPPALYVQEAYDVLSAGLDAAMRDEFTRTKIDACMESPSERAQCQARRSDAIYSAIASFVYPFLTVNREGLTWASGAIGTDLYIQAVTRWFSSASSESRRLAALVLLRYTPKVYSGALPPEAYVGLRSKSDPEIDLLLVSHFAVPSRTHAPSKRRSIWQRAPKPTRESADSLCAP